MHGKNRGDTHNICVHGFLAPHLHVSFVIPYELKNSSGSTMFSKLKVQDKCVMSTTKEPGSTDSPRRPCFLFEAELA